MSRNDDGLMVALNGVPGGLYAWIELRTETEIREAMLSLISGDTQRKKYKALALQGLLAGQYNESSAWNFSELPAEAGRIADAMLQEDREHEERDGLEGGAP